MAKKNTKSPAEETTETSKAPEVDAEELPAEPSKPKQEMYQTRGNVYDVLERTPEGVLRLGYHHAQRGLMEFHFDPSRKQKVERDDSGVFVPARGGLPGQKPKKTASSSATVDADEDNTAVELTPEANLVLKNFLALSGEDDRGEVTSNLLVEHLGKEVERLRAGASLVKKFGPELATALAGYSKEDLQKLLASARKG
jgi:hypothetical protein